MRITNNHGVPVAIMEKIEADVLSDPYGAKNDPTKFRTTELIGPPLPRKLIMEHNDDVIIDATHYLATQYGTQFHKMCEGKETDKLKYESKHGRTIDVDGVEYTLFGTIDETEFIKYGVLLTDNKTCLMANIKYPKPDNNYQLNIYRWLVGAPDAAVKTQLRIRYFIKDWTVGTKFKVLGRSTPGSPQHNDAMQMPNSSIYYVGVPLMSDEAIEDYIRERIRCHRDHTDEICPERFTVEDTFAVKIKGNKKARKAGFKTREEAQVYIQTEMQKELDKGKVVEVEDRKADAWEKDKKCQYYCAAVSVCPYAKKKGYKAL